jgi:lipopolysaccharide transport system ATP-binding protein
MSSSVAAGDASGVAALEEGARPPPAIVVRDLGKRYEMYARPHHRLLQTLWRGRRNFFREFWALRRVNFEVARGETVGIVGRNGSGKSTLLQLITGTLNPTEGAVDVRGRIAALLELGSGFNPEFTGRENVFLNGAILGISRSEMLRAMASIEDFAGIGDFIDQPVKQYSSGMMVRLAFSVAIHVTPDILLVDETLAVGDVAFQSKCLDRIRRLLVGCTAFLLVSHAHNTII